MIIFYRENEGIYMKIKQNINNDVIKKEYNVYINRFNDDIRKREKNSIIRNWKCT